DPGTTTFVPRPDWYFYFLFYLLRIFKWPDSVILGTIGIPTIALMILLAMPFVDRRTERRLLRRPVVVVTAILAVISMGVLKHKGIAFQIRHLKCPSCVNPGSPMPSFQDLGESNLRKLATFLEASKGGK